MSYGMAWCSEVNAICVHYYVLHARKVKIERLHCKNFLFNLTFGNCDF